MLIVPMSTRGYVDYNPIKLNVEVNGIDLLMELDSGSGTCVISENVYLQYFSNLKLNITNLNMCLYNGHKITPLGFIDCEVKYNNKIERLKLYVLKNGGPPLLGRDFMAKFRFSLTSEINNIGAGENNNKIQHLLDEFSDLWKDELGRFNKFEVELHLKENSVPIFFKSRPLPFALKDKIGEEIDRLIELGILIPITHSEYATPIVPVLKDNGKVKIAGDYKCTLNKDLIIDKYPMPRIEEVLAKLGGGERYSKTFNEKS